MEKVRTAVLGAGIAGLAYADAAGSDAVVFEKDAVRGGLCKSFAVDGFTFDSAVHLSFAKDPAVRKRFDQVPYHTHFPVAYNFFHGKWIKHPVSNNLYDFDAKTKTRYVRGFVERDEVSEIKNYRDYLHASYGDEIAQDFYEVYTKKYWTTDASNLLTSWVGERLCTPDLEKLLYGSYSPETGMDYYAKEMRYPVNGGYQAFLGEVGKNADVRCGMEAVAVNLGEKIIRFQSGDECHFEHLASSIPLPVLAAITEDAPDSVRCTASGLKASRVSIVSVGISHKNVSPSLWFYIYDEDILAARVNSPSMKSPGNAPDGCSSLQFEIYHAPAEVIDREQILENVRYSLKKMNLCEENEILFMDYRLLEYGNVIFDIGMEEKRDTVRSWYENQGVDLIGRFGEWDYLWSDQSFLSGYRKGKKYIMQQMPNGCTA